MIPLATALKHSAAICAAKLGMIHEQIKEFRVGGMLRDAAHSGTTENVQNEQLRLEISVSSEVAGIGPE
jgi:hypothetical protein